MKNKLKTGFFATLFLVASILIPIKNVNVYATTDWSSTDSLPTEAGDYKLTSDVVISSTWEVPSGTTTLDLNGYGIRMSSDQRVILVGSSNTLSITDSNSTRTNYITLSSWKGTSVSTSGTESISDGNGVVKVDGGYITGGYDTSYQGAAGSAIKVESEGTLNMDAGTIIGNKTGGICSGSGIFSQGTVNLSGSTKIIYNYSAVWGSAVHNDGTLYISGNTTVMKNKGSSTIHTASINLSGSPQIYDNEASVSGKGIRVEGLITINGTLSGANISVALNTVGDWSGSTDKGQLSTESDYVNDDILSQFISEYDGLSVVRYGKTLWIYKGYGVTFNTNGGSDIEPQGVLEGYKATEPEAPTKTGYNFAGWYSDSTLTNEYDFDSAVTDSIVLYAKWEAIEYTISYENLLDGTNPNTVTKYTIESDTITFSNPTRTGYTGSWDTSSIASGSTGDKTITAIWEILPGEIEVIEMDDNVGNAEMVNDADELKEMIEFTSDEEDAIEAGKNIYIFLEVEDITDSVSEDEEALAKNLLVDNSELGMFLDVNLYKQIEGESKVKIEEVDGKVKISFEIPDDLLKDGREYYIIRVHDGEADRIEATVENGVLTFETDRFSTYALAYTLSEDETEESEDSDDVTTPDSGSMNIFEGASAVSTSFATIATALIIATAYIFAKRSTKR